MPFSSNYGLSFPFVNVVRSLPLLWLLMPLLIPLFVPLLMQLTASVGFFFLFFRAEMMNFPL